MHDREDQMESLFCLIRQIVRSRGARSLMEDKGLLETFPLDEEEDIFVTALARLNGIRIGERVLDPQDLHARYEQLLGAFGGRTDRRSLDWMMCRMPSGIPRIDLDEI